MFRFLLASAAPCGSDTLHSDGQHKASNRRFQEGEWLCAHCLDYDFATQAKTLNDLRYDLERMIVGHIAISLENGLKPFANARRAPKKFWTLFSRSKISLPRQSFGLNLKKRGVKIPTPEIRVAALAA